MGEEIDMRYLGNSLGAFGAGTSRHLVVNTICGPTLICGSEGGVAFI